MAMRFHGNVYELQVNFLALFASKPHIFMCHTLKLFRIVRANVHWTFAIPSRFWPLTETWSRDKMSENHQNCPKVKTISKTPQISSKTYAQGYAIK